MNFFHLRAFHAVAKAGSFSQAASECFVSQPALSRQVQALEEDLGIQFFERHSRGVRFTEAGEFFYHYTQRIFSLVHEAEESICAFKNLEVGQLTIGMSPTVGAHILPPLVYSFHQRYPGLHLHTFVGTTPQVVARILDDELHLGVVEGELEKPTELEITPLDEEELVVVVSSEHPWSQRQEVHPQELLGEDFINREPGSKTRQLYERALAQVGVELDSMIEFSTPEAIISGVQAGLGVAILSSSSVKEQVRRGLFHTLQLQGISLKRIVKLVRRQNRLVCPAAQAFVQYLDETFAEPPAVSGDSCRLW